MENFQISSNVLNVTTSRSWSLWMDSSLADSSFQGRHRRETSPGGFGGSAHQQERFTGVTLAGMGGSAHQQTCFTGVALAGIGVGGGGRGSTAGSFKAKLLLSCSQTSCGSPGPCRAFPELAASMPPP